MGARAERLVARRVKRDAAPCFTGRTSFSQSKIGNFSLMANPVLALKKSRMVVRHMEMGSFNHVAKKYIRRTLQDTRNIDRRILFITYSGMNEKRLQYIQNLVQQYCPFERIYLQKASSAIASNCGPGSFGLLFLRRDDTAVPFFQTPERDGAA